MHKLAKDRAKIEEKCIKKNKLNVLKINRQRNGTQKKSRLSPSKCINDHEKLKDFKDASLITNSKCNRQSHEREIDIVRDR